MSEEHSPAAGRASTAARPSREEHSPGVGRASTAAGPSRAVAAPGPVAAGRRPLLLGLAAAGLAAAFALAIAGNAGVKGTSGLGDTLRAVGATGALLLVCGYAPARLLVPRSMWPHFPVFVPLVGAATAGFGLTILGFAKVPFDVSLPIVAGVGLVAAVAVRLRAGPATPDADDLAAAGGRLFTLGWPAYVAALLIALALVPVYRDGFATLLGANPDGMLGAGTAEFLQNASPGDVDPALPVDAMPSVWESKYPIYYVLAGAASISGLDPVQVFPGVAAVLIALTAAGFMLLARYGLRATAAASVLAMAFVASNRVTAHLGLHPYFNQLWGTFAFPMMLLFGLRFIWTPTRRDGILLALFLALGLAAYPLMILFPAVALGTAIWMQRKERTGIWALRPKLPRTRLWLWFPLALVVIPAGLALIAGVLDKSGDAIDVLTGSQSLLGWTGDLKHYYEIDWFFGAIGVIGLAGFIAVLWLAIVALRRLPDEIGKPLLWTVYVGLFFSFYFRIRTHGQYFEFKVVAFLLPLLLTAAAVQLGAFAQGLRTRSALGAATGAAAILIAMGTGLGKEIRETPAQAPQATFELRDWAQRLPAGASIRLDVADDRQLWGGYMLATHPLVAQRPIVGTTYPAPPQGRKADYVLADARAPRSGSRDTTGPPVFENGRYRIYRMKASVPGPDRASQRFRETLGADTHGGG